jgi:hypothetical protein
MFDEQRIPMRRNSFRSVVLSFLTLSVGALAVGCAAPAEEDSDSGSGAMAVGSSSRSPLKEGIYDSTNGMMMIYSSLGTQLATFELTLKAGQPSASCDAVVDVSIRDDAASLTHVTCRAGSTTAQSAQMLLEHSASGTTMNISGVIGGRSFDEDFTPRKRGALDGTFKARSGAKLVVSATSATDLSFRYHVQTADQSYDGEARSTENDNKLKPGKFVALYDDNLLGKCTLTFGVSRDAGKIRWISYPLGANADTAACKDLDTVWE